jgi:sugar phosphate permease
MNSQASTAGVKSDSEGVGRRARRRVAYRLLPFVFLLYVVNYIDRVNVSFANLKMSADLGLSDRAYGLGVGMFYITYVLFEIPGAVIVERWSARKWIARIMISWGIVTILGGFVNTATQFYVARLFLGAAESSFFPGMIVYLTHWFCVRDRSRAIACLYAANSDRCFDRFALGRLAPRCTLAPTRWLALALYSGRNSCRCSGDHHLLLYDRPTYASTLASS